MKRLWLATTLLFCGLMSAWTGAQAAYGDDDATGAQLVPKDTLMFFSIPSVADMKEDFDKSLGGALFRDPELKPFLDDVRKKIDELSDKLRDEVGVTIPELLAIPKGEVTLALMERPTAKLAPVLIVDYGDSKEIVDKLLKKLHDALDGDLAEHEKQDFKDISVHVYKFKDQDPDNPFQTLAYFNDDKCLVFSSEVAALKEILDRWEGDSTDTLANDDTFKYVQERCKSDSDEPDAVWYISPIGLINSGLAMAQTTVPQVGMAKLFLPQLGLDKLKGFGGAGYYGSGEFDAVNKMFLYAEQPTGVLNVFQFPATDLTPPKWVPADATKYVGANWNAAQAYQAIESMIDGVYGRGFTAKRLDAMASADNGPGIHIKKDVLDLLDGKLHVMVGADSKDDDSAVPQFLMAVDVKDGAKAKKILAKAAKSDRAGLETREFNGETIYEAGSDERSISIAVAGNQFVLTNDAAALEGMLRTTTAAPLAESSVYRKIAKNFPAKVSMLSYSRTDTQLKAAYELLKNAEDIDFLEGIDLQKLPPFEVLEKYLRPSGFYGVPDKKGALFVDFQLSEGDK